MHQKIHNLVSYFKHRILHAPIFMQAPIIRGSKNPKYTVVFLHGIAATSTTWQKTIPELLKNKNLDEMRFISLDLLGFGKSLQADWLNYDYDDYLKSLRRTLKKLKIKSNIILVGHSMGSLIAAKFAEAYPEKISELIFVSPPILMPKEQKKIPDNFYTKIYSSLHEVADDPAIKTLATFVEKLSTFRKKYLNMKSFQYSMKNIILNQENYKTFKNLKIKSTIIHGRFDPLVYRPNLQTVADNNKNIDLISVMGDHDITSSKIKKINLILERTVKNETL